MGRRLLIMSALLASIYAILVAAPAVAQGAPPANVRPPTREEIQRDTPRPGPSAPPRLTVESDIERAPCPLASPQFQDMNFTLTEVQFANLKGVAKEDLTAAYSAYVGKSVPIAMVCEIRDAAATILRRQGYLAAIQVPPQRIENGVLRLDVLMARVTRLQVHGDAGRAERRGLPRAPDPRAGLQPTECRTLPVAGA